MSLPDNRSLGEDGLAGERSKNDGDAGKYRSESCFCFEKQMQTQFLNDYS